MSRIVVRKDLGYSVVEGRRLWSELAIDDRHIRVYYISAQLHQLLLLSLLMTMMFVIVHKTIPND